MSYLNVVKNLKFKVKKVECEGIAFYLRELSGRARLDFEKEKDLETRVLKMMHSSLCDENGALTEDPKDFNAFIEAVPNKVVNVLVKEFSELNIAKEENLKN